MTSIDDRLAGLSPEKRRLLLKRLADRRLAAAVPVIERSEATRAPLTFAQRRLWFLEQLAPGSPLYNNPSAIDGTGPLDASALERALGFVVRRHEALRTRLVPEGDEAVQVVVAYGEAPGGLVPLEVEDLRSLLPAEREARTRDLLIRTAEDPFDLAVGPLMRARLILHSEDRWTLAVTFHHLVSDAWSAQRFLAELVAGYRAAAAGRTPALPELPIQYGDFARWQRSDACAAELDRQRAWWIERLSGAPTTLSLPLDRPRRASTSHAGDSVRFRLEPAVADALRRLAAEREGTTLFMVLLAGFSALLHRLSGDTDLCLGTAIAGRSRPETDPLIGLFVNTLVLRVDASGGPTFLDLLERVSKTAVSAFAHPDVPFEQLVEALPVPRDAAMHPLFQVLFLLQNVPTIGHPLAELDLEIEPRAVSNRRARFDLTLSLFEAEGSLAGSAEYATDLFDRATIEAWCAAYATLLGAAAAHPEARIGDLPLGLSPSLVRPEPLGGASSGRSVAERFSEMAARFFDQRAVGFEDRWWSYAELERISGRLAQHLVARGIGPEARVGLAAERGLAEWAGMLAVWKAGAAYVPLDPGFPVERLAWIVASSGVRLVLTAGSGAALALPEGVDTLSLDALLAEEGAPSDEAPLAATDEGRRSENESADRLAYVLYTSGSTGRPKGVSVSHRSLLFFLDAMTARLAWGPDTALLAVTTLGFDIALLERWGPLLVGGTSQVVSAPEAADGRALAARIASSRANVLQGTPATWRILREAGWPSELEGARALTALVGGEALPVELARWLAGRAREVFNLYGPTETTVWSTAHRFVDDGSADHGAYVELGQALGATRLAVVGSDLEPAPVGVWGELVIGGPGVARGYEGRGGETALRFVPDPFGAAPGARMYRTGDVCRLRLDGRLEFGGRRDGQVKLRGHRIETGEIEARLLESEQVAAAAVVVTDETLVAFVVPAPAVSLREAEVAALASALARALPAYMVPRRIEVLDALPLTPNGKLDRRALAANARALRAARGGHVAPRTATEATLEAIFCEVLALEKVSVEANFFELGGHSLLATRVAARIREQLGREVALRALFEAPTVATLAARVEATEASLAGPALVAVPAGERPALIPLSHAQERLWFLDQLHPGDAAYAIPLVLRLEGNLDLGALEQALADVVRRHEVLRTTFLAVGGKPRQNIHPPGSELARRAACIEHVDLSSLGGEAQQGEARAHALRAAQAPFDLEAGPLLRSTLIRLGERSHLAVLVMHHIVSDGWSVGVLSRELAALYEARCAGVPSPLLPLPIQFADWALCERAFADRGALAAGVELWARVLKGVPAELELPADRPATSGPRFAARRRLVLEPAIAAGARRLAQAHEATLFMVLLAGYAAALYAEGAGDDLVIGCPSAGREDPRLEPAIGFFVNTLPLRLTLDGARTLADLVAEARDRTLSGLAHRHIPFARIAEAAAGDGRVPPSLGQLWFVLQNVPRPMPALGDLSVQPVPAEEIAGFANGLLPARYELKLELGEAEDGAITGGFEYRVDRFDEATVGRIAARFVELLDAMVQTPERTLGEWRRRAADRAAGELADHRRRGLERLRTRRPTGA